jgi:hypothetical protein
MVHSLAVLVYLPEKQNCNLQNDSRTFQELCQLDVLNYYLLISNPPPVKSFPEKSSGAKIAIQFKLILAQALVAQMTNINCD